MRVRFMSLVAAALLLAACETAPETAATTSGSGAQSGSGTTSSVIAAPVKGSQADLVASVGDRVFFDFDKYDLKPDARATVEKQAQWLKGNPGVKASVEGHADERGTREYNLALGERRANAVRSYLTALGIDPNRIATVSYGKERPEVVGSNDWAWSQNRRGVLIVN